MYREKTSSRRGTLQTMHKTPYNTKVSLASNLKLYSLKKSRREIQLEKNYLSDIDVIALFLLKAILAGII